MGKGMYMMSKGWLALLHRVRSVIPALLLTTVAVQAQNAPLDLASAAPGVYFENSGPEDWVALQHESARRAELTADGEVTNAALSRAFSKAELYAPLRMVVRTEANGDICKWKLVKIRRKDGERELVLRKPVEIQWTYLSNDLFEIHLPADLADGEYALIPPSESDSRIYAFRLRRTPLS